MARIHIDNVAAGMVVTQDVCDRSGRMLLPAGETLSDRHLQIFRMWGVVEVETAGDDSAEGETEQAGTPLDPVLAAQAKEEVMRLFVHNDPEHPAIKELMRLCVERRVARAQ